MIPFCTHWTSQTLLSFLLLCIFQKEKNIHFETFWKSSTYLFKSIEIHWKNSFCNIASEVSYDYFQTKIWIFAPKKLQQILLEIFCWLYVFNIFGKLVIQKVYANTHFGAKIEMWHFFGDFQMRHLCWFSNTMNRSIEIAMHCSRDNLKKIILKLKWFDLKIWKSNSKIFFKIKTLILVQLLM